MLSVLSKAAIHITYSDPDGDYEGGRNGAHSAVKSGTYCAVKTTPPNKTFARRVLQHPPTDASDVGSMRANQPQSAVHAAQKATAMVDWCRFKRPKAL